MSLPNLLVLVALGGAVLTLVYGKGRLLPIIALCIAGVLALLAFRVISLDLKGVPLGLLLGGGLAVVGGIIWFRSGAKLAVTGASLVTLVGALLVFTSLMK
jgi:hypothetical protein